LMRNSFVNGSLCLNCDAPGHRPTDCSLKRRVCWNCHGSHPGGGCDRKCRFCLQYHPEVLIMDCIKKASQRVNLWKHTKPCKEQAQLDKQVLIVRAALRDMAKQIDPAAVDSGEGPIKLPEEFTEKLRLKAAADANMRQVLFGLKVTGVLLDDDLQDILGAMTVAPKPPPAMQSDDDEQEESEGGRKQKKDHVIGPAAPPKEPHPPLPDPKFPWAEKIFLDDVLPPSAYGVNVLTRLMGKRGANHRRMEEESGGARIFFRGLGVGAMGHSSDDAEMRAHLLVKGTSHDQAKAVLNTVRDIVSRMEADLAAQKEAGRRKDRLMFEERGGKDPFGFLVHSDQGPLREQNQQAATRHFSLSFKSSAADPDGDDEAEAEAECAAELENWGRQAGSRAAVQVEVARTPTAQAVGLHLGDMPTLDEASSSIGGVPAVLVRRVAGTFRAALEQWHGPGPVWFEEHELQLFGPWSLLMPSLSALSPMPAAREEFKTEVHGPLSAGEYVRLSEASALEVAAKLRDAAVCTSQDSVEGLSAEVIAQCLRQLRGTVRAVAEGETLLRFMRYPLSFFAVVKSEDEQDPRKGQISTELPKIPLAGENLQAALRSAGRVGSVADLPVEALLPPDFAPVAGDEDEDGRKMQPLDALRGIVVDWQVPDTADQEARSAAAAKAAAEHASKNPDIIAAEERALNVDTPAPTTRLPPPALSSTRPGLAPPPLTRGLDPYPTVVMPPPVPPVPLGQVPPPPVAMAAASPSPPPALPATVKHLICRVDFPVVILQSPEDVRQEICGEDDSNFAHIISKADDAVQLTAKGTQNGADGDVLHVILKAPEAAGAAFRKAKELLVDLVEAIVEGILEDREPPLEEAEQQAVLNQIAVSESIEETMAPTPGPTESPSAPQAPGSRPPPGMMQGTTLAPPPGVHAPKPPAGLVLPPPPHIPGLEPPPKRPRTDQAGPYPFT